LEVQAPGGWHDSEIRKRLFRENEGRDHTNRDSWLTGQGLTIVRLHDEELHAAAKWSR